MIVVSDTSSLSALIRLDLIEILPKIFGNIIVPPAVYHELSYLGKQGYDISSLFEAEWFLVQTPVDQHLIKELSVELDPGEVEAISLAKELVANFLLIDEKKERAIAHRLGISIVGLLGVFLLAKKEGQVKSIKPHLIRLKDIGFRVSNDLIKLVLKEADEI